MAAAAAAAAALVLNDGDTAWMLVATALVFFMTLGVGFFYGGSTSHKSLTATIGYIFVIHSVVSIVWLFLGFSFAYGDATSTAGIIGGFQYGYVNGVGMAPVAYYAETYPFILCLYFELTFASVTGCLVLGGAIERVRFSSFLIFIAIWTLAVYAPLSCWVWNENGWAHKFGIMDFAGGSVVEINCGFSSLGVALLLGKRKNTQHKPSNIPLALLGTAIIWFGWLGFNGGTAGAANGIAAYAALNTNMAACAAGLVFIGCEWVMHQKVQMLSFAGGTICGMVAISPAAGYISPIAAVVTGGVAGVISYFFINWQKGGGEVKFWDDPVDMVGCHGLGGAWGLIATGLFASVEINAEGYNGLFYGHAMQVPKQLLLVVASSTYATVVSYFIMWLLSLVMEVRVTEKEEVRGLDKAIHNEESIDLKSILPERFLNQDEEGQSFIRNEPAPQS